MMSLKGNLVKLIKTLSLYWKEMSYEVIGYYCWVLFLYPVAL